MNIRESVVGESVICSGNGIGKIIDVAPLHEGGEEFYKVSFPKDKCVNYFSVNNKSSYRILSSEVVIKKAIKIFNSKIDKVEYRTTQEKINTQREMLKEEDIVKLSRTLSMINSEKEIHAQISKPFKDSLNTFIEEIVFVLDIKKSEAYSILNLKAPPKKVKK
ncbi:hypothetical protein BIY24_03890 [Halobacteriovorax marinus]|uniref:hypothetical protein n=1 Tax=Halobacteriovorax marinus TaxID=97084 RepID=UPI000BC31197|nr:hypothetical protein [Halobacteriovorax marinus]ATH07108.1 hypothetical protein BIY24_03890 [Halobacteriovorax marinus]